MQQASTLPPFWNGLPDPNVLRWAAICAASVEWLCGQDEIPCPSWVHNDAHCLPEPWFDSPGAYKPQVRERLVHETPEPFAGRNIFCGNRVFANKYAFAADYQQFATAHSAATSALF